MLFRSRQYSLTAHVKEDRIEDAWKLIQYLGGRDKGGDWGALVDAARERVRSVLVIGAETASMLRRFSDVGEILECGTLERAVETALANAAAGDVVLLSPACASFDQFDGFEQRGEAFRQAVRALGERHA